MPAFADMATPALVNLLVMLGAAFILSRGFRFANQLPQPRRAVVTGIGFGLMAICTMLAAFPLVPGVLGDFRNVVVAIAAVVGGPVSAMVAAAFAVVFRLFLGGSFETGVAGIVIAAVLAIGFVRLPTARKPLPLALFGLALALSNAVLPLAAMVSMGRPPEEAWPVVFVVLCLAVPSYPTVMVLLGKLLLDEQGRALEEVELKRANAELSMEAARSNGVFETSGVPMLWGDFQGRRIMRVNQAYADFLGYDRPEELIGKQFVELIPPEDREATAQRLLPFYTGKAPWLTEEVRYRRKDSTIAWGHRTMTAIMEKGELRHTFSVVQDITERKRAREEINRLVSTDPVTGLLNRLAFTAELTAAITDRKSADCVAIVCFDVGDLYGANDVIGRLANRSLLHRAGRYLKEAAGEQPVLSRILAGTYGLMLTGVRDAPGVPQLAQTIAERLRTAFAAEEPPLSPDISVGIAIAPEHGQDAEGLILKAEIARDAARTSLPRVRVFEPEMEAVMRGRQEIKADLGLALVNGEFELHYQPVVSLHSGAVVGMEALIRWRHPRRGLISPGDFIPIAEESGLIAPIGEWVLNQACQDAIDWPDHVGIAVNVSPIQFEDSTLPLRIASILARSRLAAGRLEIEVTESVFLASGGASLKTLEDIRQLGVKLALDDFGTGYSSLSYLQRFAFDKIKIDRAFVSDIASREESRAVMRAVIELGQSLNIAITAEGVETREQLDSVRNHGCDQVQGFLFSPPVPAAEAIAVIERIEGRPVQRPRRPASRFTGR